MKDDMLSPEDMDFEPSTSEFEDDLVEYPELRQWDSGVDAFVIGSKEHTGACSWLWGIFAPKCKSTTCLVAGIKSWFEYRIDPAFLRPIIGQPKDAISTSPEAKYGADGQGLPVVHVTVGAWKSYWKERWLCRFGGLGAGIFLWVVSHGGLFQKAAEPMGPFWLFVLVGWVLGHELSLRFEWRIRGPLDYQKFRLQRRCWWAFCDGLWMMHLRRLEKGL